MFYGLASLVFFTSVIEKINTENNPLKSRQNKNFYGEKIDFLNTVRKFSNIKSTEKVASISYLNHCNKFTKILNDYNHKSNWFLSLCNLLSETYSLITKIEIIENKLEILAVKLKVNYSTHLPKVENFYKKISAYKKIVLKFKQEIDTLISEIDIDVSSLKLKQNEKIRIIELNLDKHKRTMMKIESKFIEIRNLNRKLPQIIL